MITTTLIETAFEQVILTNFQNEILLKKSFPELIALAKLEKHQEILEIVTGYTLPILSKPLRRPVLIKKKKDFTDRISHDRKKVEGLLSKGAIPSVNQLEDQFLRTFLVPKKDVNQRPVISSNKRQLNQFIPCQHFKTDCLHSLKEVLPARRGLYVQAGFEGCLFLCPI